MWFTDTLAVRLLVHVFHTTNNETEISQTDFGISGGVEFHFASRELSPYAGGLLGVLTEMETDQDTFITMYFGGFIGVELQIFKSLSLFGEYDLLITLYDWGYTIDFGTLPEAQVGLIIYF